MTILMFIIGLAVMLLLIWVVEMLPAPVGATGKQWGKIFIVLFFIAWVLLETFGYGFLNHRIV